jgi:hypothetical protein
MQTANDVYHIYFDPKISSIVMEWDGYATSEQFKQGTELMLNLLVQHNCSKVLADIKDMVIIGMEDQEWLLQQFIPRAIEFGFRSLAIIQSEHYFNKVAVETVSYRVDKNKLRINFFDNSIEAKTWLATI